MPERKRLVIQMDECPKMSQQPQDAEDWGDTGNEKWPRKSGPFIESSVSGCAPKRKKRSHKRWIRRP
jgi:hypothetical protein